MDAINFILKEHAQIRKAFKQLKKSLIANNLKKTKFTKLSQFLVRHETMEEKVWYPKLRRKPLLKKVIKLLITEEKTAAKAIKKIKATKDANVWKKSVLKLALAVNKHANDEEKKLFPKVRKLIDKAELNLIGTKLSKFKSQRKTGKTI